MAVVSTDLLHKKFESYDALKVFIRHYEDENYTQLFISHSRTIEGARRRGFKGFVKQELQYTEIHYKCIFGGERKSRSTGKRPHQSTYRQQCPFYIRVKALEDVLLIVNVKDEHNHTLNKETHSFLPRQRMLEGPTKELTKHMLKLKANKKLLQAELMQTTNKNVTLKDLHNLGQNNNDDTLQGALQYLMERTDNIVELVKNDENVLLAIFYQDTDMKRVFNCYPEIIFVDAIHKVSDRRMPLYIVLVEDSNGDSEIVGFYLVSNEEKTTMEQLPKLFKKHNPAWEKTQSIMTDKDFVERDVFRKEFPNSKMLICLFHTLQTFHREITCEKMGITSGERDTAREILEKLAYSSTEKQYDENFKQLEETKLKNVLTYYKSNWHPIRAEWVVGFQQSSLTLGNRTNNRLESINSKVVQVVNRNSKLTELFQNLDNLLVSLRTERNSRVAKVQNKVPLVVNVTDTERQYMQVLTPYAYNLVSEKFKLKSKVKVVSETDGHFSIMSRNSIYTTTASNCTCVFFKSMQLPCNHIFRVREMMGINMFSDEIFSVRWTKAYYVSNSRLLVKTDAVKSTTSTVNVQSSKRVFSQHEKYKLVSERIGKLASLASEAPARLFQQRLEVINSIIQSWSTGSEVGVIEIVSNDGELAFNPDIPDTINVTEITATNTAVSTTECNTSGSVSTDSYLINTAADHLGRCVTEIVTTVPPAQNAACNSAENVSTDSTERYIPTDNLPILPPKMKKRGRPKGSDLTAIGLPRKRAKSSRTIAFERKHPKVKHQIMLQWFVSAEDAKSAINGLCILDEQSVEQNPSRVSSACLDENICILNLKQYFTEDAWLAVKHLLEVKRKQSLWLCPICKTDAQQNSICCNSCLEWYHLSCAHLKQAPKKAQWFCGPCHTSNI